MQTPLQWLSQPMPATQEVLPVLSNMVGISAEKHEWRDRAPMLVEVAEESASKRKSRLNKIRGKKATNHLNQNPCKLHGIMRSTG